jgi:hypothetical protein
MADALALLPKGFTLDPPPPSAADPVSMLPKGFTLDAPPVPAASGSSDGVISVVGPATLERWQTNPPGPPTAGLTGYAAQDAAQDYSDYLNWKGQQAQGTPTQSPYAVVAPPGAPPAATPQQSTPQVSPVGQPAPASSPSMPSAAAPSGAPALPQPAPQLAPMPSAPLQAPLQPPSGQPAVAPAVPVSAPQSAPGPQLAPQPQTYTAPMTANAPPSPTYTGPLPSVPQQPAGSPGHPQNTALQGASDAAFATLDQIPGASQLGAATDAALGYMFGDGSQAPSFGQRYQENLQANLARLNGIPMALRVPAGIVGAIPAAITGGAAVGAGAAAPADAVPAVAPAINALSNLPALLRYAGAGAAQGAAQGASDAPTNADIVPNALTGLGLGAATGVALPAVGRVVSGAARAVTNYARPFVGRVNALTDEAGNAVVGQNGKSIIATPGQVQMAGRQLANSADDPDAVRAALAGGPNEIVPGSTPTTFQQTGDMGLGGLERAVATRNRGAFNQVGADQNTARLASLRSFRGTGDPGQVRAVVRAHIDAIDKTVSDLQGKSPAASARIAQASEGQVARARGAADHAAAGLGGQETPEAYGSAMRARSDAAERAGREQETALWDAVDPEGKLVMDVTPIRKEAKAITGEHTKSAAPFSSAENQIYGVAGSYRAGEPFKEVSDLRQNINAAIARELEHGRTPAYARLSRFKAVLDNAIDSAVERHAQREALAVAEGRMRPGDTIAARLQQENDTQAISASNTSGRQGERGGSPVVGAGRTGPADGILGGRGTASQGARGPGDAGRNPGLAAGSADQRSAPSLLTFLTRRGGIKDPGGDLAAMDARLQRVGLVRSANSPFGESLDYAREAAEEAGYLRPGSNTNDLL